jgi:hypothetical protein
MPGEPVHIDRAPFNARLLAWGRAADGWWGLVEWAQTVRSAGALSTMPFAAWLPAAAVRKPGWSGGRAADVARLTLPPRRADWPGPAAWRGWFAGVWAGGPVPLPPGVELDNGPAWRR